MKKNNLKKILIAVLVLSIWGCNQKPKISAEIETYLISAIDSIQVNALMSPNMDWEKVKRESLEKAEGLETTEQTYPIIKSILEKLNDNHSFLQKGGKNLSYPNNKEKREPSPYGSRMQIEYGLHNKDGKTFARIFVPQGMRGNEFAQNLQDRIFEMQSSNPCGWIVDLRGNGGGNMWPMLAGIGPLVGSNPLGGSENGRGQKDFYKYDNGKAVYTGVDGKEESWAQADQKVKVLSEDIPIAFLIDRGTASSGEALSVIFKGRKNSKSFGEKTYGASTSTRGILLSDSLNLVIAISTFQDRNGNLYLNGVEPEMEIPVGEEMVLPENDPLVESALNWLNENCNETN